MPGEQNTRKRETLAEVIKQKVTVRDLEKMEVARLCCEIEPRSKPSDLFEKLEQKRRTRHENVLAQLAKSLHELNLKTEKNITISSKELKAHLQDFDQKLRAILERIDNGKVSYFCASSFAELQNKANKYKVEQQHLVNEFYRDLIHFENDRARENGKLLHLACEEIRKIGYFLPYDVQSFVEHETLKMNQLSLNNRRCYEDLKLTLTLVTEQTFKSFMDKVFCIRENWIQSRLHTTFYNRESTEIDDKSRKSAPKTYVRLELTGEELPFRTTKDGLHSSCTSEEWMKNVEKIVRILDSFGKNLIEIYKKSLKGVYNGFSSEIEEIKAGISLVEDLVIEERTIKPLLIELEPNEGKEIEELETHWQNTLEEIRNQLKYVMEFVQELANLWDGHSHRVCESKILILNALEKSERINQAILQDLEIKLNLGLDALRQEYVPSKLEKAYETVVATLGEIQAKYESIYVDEVSIVEDFYKMMNLEADILSADIQGFIYETSGVKFLQGYSGQLRFLRETEVGEKSIYKEIKSCAQQVQNVKLWKQGIWVALEIVSANPRTALEPRAVRWVKSKVEALAEKKSTELELLDKRLQRIQVEIYEKRLSEINKHQELFDKHKERIEINLKNANRELHDLVANQLQKINYITDNINEIERNAMLENLPGVIRGNQIMIERKKQELEEYIETEFQRFRANCETRLTDCQQVNLNFMKTIKLFHEGGNYSADEGKAFINMLEATDKEIVTELTETVKNSTKEENELMKRVSGIFSPLIALFSLLHEETLFNQEIQQRLESFTAYIQDSAKALKQDFDFFNQHISCVTNYTENSDNFINLSEEELWNFLTKLLCKNVTNLIYPIQIPISSAQNEKEEVEQEAKKEDASVLTNPCCCAGNFQPNIPSSTNFLQRKSEKAESLGCKDYVQELFNSQIPLEDNGTFMATMCKNFLAEMSVLQKTACNFYKKIQGRRIIREDLISTTYENFIDGILTKFNYYNIQIQKFWLQLLLDFLPLLGGIKLLANHFIQKKLYDYKYLALESLKNCEAAFKNCLESQMCENAKELEDLDSKLLPLHGYPNNVHLLNELEETVVRRTATQEITWETAFKNFRIQLKCFRVQHIQEKFEIKKIERLHLLLQETIFVDDLGLKLVEQILKICKLGGFCLKKLSRDSITYGTAKYSYDEVPEEHKLGLPSENFCPVQELIEKLRQIIERERLWGNQMRSTSPSLESQEGENVSFSAERLNLLLEITEFKEPAFGATETLEQYVRYLKKFAESREALHETELFNWLKRWKFNVNKIQKLYSIKCEGKVPTSEAEVKRENNKPNPEKTSASVTSPRLCPTTKLDIKDISCNIPKLKIRCPRDRPISDEYKKRSDVLEYPKTNLQKSKLTEFNSSGQVGYTNAALFLTSPRNYHGQIPVFHKRSLNLLRMSPPTTRSPSPLKKILAKDKSSGKVKTITLETKKKKAFDASRSPSPIKRAALAYRKSRSRLSSSPIQGNQKNSEKIKRLETGKQMSPRINSPTKRKSKPTALGSPKLEYSKSKRKELQAKGHVNPVILKQTSQPSLCINEKIIKPQEKISLDRLKNEVYSGDHRRLSFEKVHLCIEKSVENLNVAERKRSYLVTYSSDDYKNQEEISLAFLQDLSSTSITTYSTDGDRKRGGERIQESKAAIRTLSGHELILTPSMKLDIEKGETDDIEISDLLHETGESFEDSKVRIPQDDANEYDSEVSTDGELTTRNLTAVSSKCKDLHSGNSLWKNQEAELLNDVDYRQSVYHPAVSRRQKSESLDSEFRPKSKSIEDTFGFNVKKRVTRSRSSTMKTKYPTQCFSRDKIDACNNDSRSWSSGFDKTDGKQIYNSVMQDVPFYGMKRSRTKKERVSGALLHFTLKVIRLLAIFNLWPGDNCYMMTSQSLRFAR